MKIVLLFLTDEQKEKYYIIQIRSHLSICGHNMENYSDDQIKASGYKIADNIGTFGCTADEAANVFRVLGKT